MPCLALEKQRPDERMQGERGRAAWEMRVVGDGRRFLYQRFIASGQSCALVRYLTWGNVETWGKDETLLESGVWMAGRVQVDMAIGGARTWGELTGALHRLCSNAQVALY